MLVTENVTVKDATEGAEVPAGVWTVIGPVVAPGGTATLSDVAATFVGTPNTPPAKLTRSALPKPVPLTFTMSPTAPLSGETFPIRGSIVKSPAVRVRPPAGGVPDFPGGPFFRAGPLRIVSPPPSLNGAP